MFFALAFARTYVRYFYTLALYLGEASSPIALRLEASLYLYSSSALRVSLLLLALCLHSTQQARTQCVLAVLSLSVCVSV